MPLVAKDRVQETSTTTGTGTLTLYGAVIGFQTFSSAIGNGNTCYYAINGGAEWEVGLGTVGVGTLTRDTVLESSNSGSLVNFSAGTKNVFVTYPAERSITADDVGVTIQAYDSNTTKNNISNTFTSGQVIAISSTNPTLKLTQAGTGAALFVEDSTSPDLTPTVIDNAGRLIVGSEIPYTISGSTAKRVQSHSVGGDAGYSSSFWGNSQAGTSQQLMKSRGTTVGDYAAVTSGDTIGTFLWGGADGTQFAQSASIFSVVDGAVATNSVPGSFRIATTSVGSTTPTEKVRITSAGNLGIGTTSPTEKLEVTGNVKSNKIILNGSTSGSVTLDTPAVAGTATITLPTTASSSTTNTVTNKIAIVINGTTYYLLASTNGT